MTQGRKAGMLPYGNGCKLHPDCFSCPVRDCVWLYGANEKKQEELVKLWKPSFMKLSKSLGGNE